MTPKRILVLVAEDNDDHLMLTTFMLQKVAGSDVDIQAARDGDEVLDYLHGRGEHAGAKRPDLLLLDLSMPRKHGFEVLEEVKADAELSSLPVVVLTSSSQPEDVDRAYALGANAYAIKSRGTEELMAVWTKIVQLPSRP